MTSLSYSSHLPPVIEIEGLWYRFPAGATALEDIHLKIYPGEFVLLAGLNGSGKTTLLKHFNGLIMASQGLVRVDGRPVGNDLIRVRKRVGMVFQDADTQIVGETVYADVAFGPENLGIDRDEIHRRVMESLEQVGLEHAVDQRPHRLSGGEKKRLAIAGVLAMKPGILVFDEPFSHLDYQGITRIFSQIRSLHASGHTIVVSSHELKLFHAVANRLVLLVNGRIVGDGPLADLLPVARDLGIIGTG